MQPHGHSKVGSREAGTEPWPLGRRQSKVKQTKSERRSNDANDANETSGGDQPVAIAALLDAGVNPADRSLNAATNRATPKTRA